MSEESTTNDQSQDEIIEDEEEMEEPEEEVDQRLKKSVSRMIKQASKYKSFKKEKLVGKSLEEQYDLLDFFLENMPSMKSKNKPPVGTPINIGKKMIDGIVIQENPNTGRKSYVIDPSTLFKIKKQE